MQPNRVSISRDKFIDGHAFDQLRPRNSFLFAVDEDCHEILFSLRRARFSEAVSLRFGVLIVCLLRTWRHVHTSLPRLVAILRRRFAHALDDTRVGDRRDGLVNPVHLHLMIPVVAKVEPVPEGTTMRQIQVVQLGRACVSISLLPLVSTEIP